MRRAATTASDDSEFGWYISAWSPQKRSRISWPDAVLGATWTASNRLPEPASSRAAIPTSIAATIPTLRSRFAAPGRRVDATTASAASVKTPAYANRCAATPACSTRTAPAMPNSQYARPSQALPSRGSVRRWPSHGHAQTAKTAPSTARTAQITRGRLVKVQVKMPAVTKKPPTAAPRSVTPGRLTASAATVTANRAASNAFAASPRLAVREYSTAAAPTATAATTAARMARRLTA